jgi:hypothetical protein
MQEEEAMTASLQKLSEIANYGSNSADFIIAGDGDQYPHREYRKSKETGSVRHFLQHRSQFSYRINDHRR